MRVARGVLIGIGVLLLAVAAGLLVASVKVGQWPGILLWLAAAVVLHDAVLSPVLLVGNRLLRRAGRRLPWAAIGVVQATVVVGGAITLVAIPGIAAQSIGARNPSVLVHPYGLHLLVAWVVLGLLATTAVLLLHLVGRSRRDLPTK